MLSPRPKLSIFIAIFIAVNVVVDEVVCRVTIEIEAHDVPGEIVTPILAPPSIYSGGSNDACLFHEQEATGMIVAFGYDVGFTTRSWETGRSENRFLFHHDFPDPVKGEPGHKYRTDVVHIYLRSTENLKLMLLLKKVIKRMENKR